MIIPRVTVGALTRETVVAMESLGGKGGRAIQCHQALIPEETETVSQVVRCKALKDLEKDGVAMARGDRIAEGSALIVAGNLLDAKQGLGVRASLAFLEPALVLQKRWRWGKEEAEGAAGGVWHTVWRIVAFATVGPWIDLSLESDSEIIEA